MEVAYAGMARKKRAAEEAPKEMPLPNPDEGTIICIVERVIGADYLLVRCADGAQRKARIPGSMRRKVWMREGDIVLVAPWDFKPDRADVVYRYRGDEVKRLVEQGLVPQELLELAEELA